MVDFRIIDLAASFAYEALAKPVDNFFLIHLEVDHVVHFDMELFEDRMKRARLSDRSRKSVKDEPVLTAVGLQDIFYQADHDIIGHKLPVCHVFVRLDSERRSFIDRVAKYIPGRNVRDMINVREDFCLRPFADTWSSKKYDVHGQVSRLRNWR
jgi:hypothetical protein